MIWPLPDEVLKTILIVIAATAAAHYAYITWLLRKIRSLREQLLWLIAQAIHADGLKIEELAEWPTGRPTLSKVSAHFHDNISVLIRSFAHKLAEGKPADLTEDEELIDAITAFYKDSTTFTLRARRISYAFDTVYCVGLALIVASLVADLVTTSS